MAHYPSAPIATGEKLPGIDFDLYVPTVVARMASQLRASANRYFTERFGLTLFEWRILSHVASVGPCSAYDIWTSQSLEKSAVSRAARDLAARELIHVEDVPGARRRTTRISLTEEGRRRYLATTAEVGKRHARLLGALGAKEARAFLDTLTYLESRISLMGSEAEPIHPDTIDIWRA